MPFIPEHLTTGFLHNGGIEIPTDRPDEAEIAVRILSMIMNEAAFAVGEGVASVRDIDIAMKLGTNYPKGPLKWSDEIGLELVAKARRMRARVVNGRRVSPVTLRRWIDRSDSLTRRGRSRIMSLSRPYFFASHSR